ncbi:hypothetical protein [Glutamicibacter sp. X7]
MVIGGLFLGVIILVLTLLVLGLSSPWPAERTVRWIARLSLVAAIGTVILVGYEIIDLLLGVQSRVHIPVMDFWPANLPEYGLEFTGAPATLDSATISSADIQVTGLSWSTTLVLVAGLLGNGLGAFAVALGMRRLALKINAGEPFAASLRRTGRWVAALLLASSILGPLLYGIGAARASDEALRFTGCSATNISCMDYLPRPGLGIEFSFAGLVSAMGILLVVELVAIGMQKNAENLALKNDLDGLV